MNKIWFITIELNWFECTGILLYTQKVQLQSLTFPVKQNYVVWFQDWYRRAYKRLNPTPYLKEITVNDILILMLKIKQRNKKPEKNCLKEEKKEALEREANQNLTCTGKLKYVDLKWSAISPKLCKLYSFLLWAKPYSSVGLLQA